MLDAPGSPSERFLESTRAPALRLAPWHAARPHVLANALCEARHAAPHLSPLADRLLPWMPRRPSASQNLRSSCRDPASGPLLLEGAITCPWVCPNTEQGWNVLTADVDHADALDLCDDLASLGLPRPMIVMDPWSGRSHVWAPLETPVSYLPGARVSPQILADLACRLLAAYFRATPLPRGALVKNPWGRVDALIGQRLYRNPTPAVPLLWDAYQEAATGLMWHTIPGSGRFELRAIVEALVDYADVALPSRRGSWRRKKRGDPSWVSRNGYVFDLTRWWAYDREERDGGLIHDEAMRVNATLAIPLPASAIAATARSITRFMTTRFRPRAQRAERPGRGRDKAAGADLALQARQSLAGKVTGAACASATDTRILEAVGRFRDAGETFTQEQLAAASACSLRTIKRRWHVLVIPPVRNAASQDAASASASAPTPAADALPAPTARVPNAVRLSGGAGLVPALPPQAGLEEPNPLSSSLRPTFLRFSSRASLSPAPLFLADVSRRNRAIRRILADLVTATEQARRPGAVPGSLPLVPFEFVSVPEVRRAEADALAAMSDASRRAANRDARREATARAEEMLRRARTNISEAWRWFREDQALLDLYWSAQEKDASEQELVSIGIQRKAAFGARWRQWNTARRTARDLPPACPIDEAELETVP